MRSNVYMGRRIQRIQRCVFVIHVTMESTVINCVQEKVEPDAKTVFVNADSMGGEDSIVRDLDARV